MGSAPKVAVRGADRLGARRKVGIISWMIGTMPPAAWHAWLHAALQAQSDWSDALARCRPPAAPCGAVLMGRLCNLQA